MENISLECGWGKLLFGTSFSSHEKLAQELKKERKTARNIAFNIQDPQIFFSQFPTEFFLNPGYVYEYSFEEVHKSNFSFEYPEYSIRKAETEEDIAKLDEIYRSLGMVPIGTKWFKHLSPAITILIVEDKQNKKIWGGVTWIHHKKVSKKLENEVSLWALAVSTNCPFSGVGKKLVQSVLHSAHEENAEKLFLSVLASNAPAISLYEAMGFKKTNIISLKNKTSINQKLFMCTKAWENIPAKEMILVNEALKRGIHTEPVSSGFFRFSFSGKQLQFVEGVTELTNAMTLEHTKNKKIFHALLAEEKLPMRPYCFYENFAEAKIFLEKYKKIRASSLKSEYEEENISTQLQLQKNIRRMHFFHDEIFLQEKTIFPLYRILIIDGKVVSVISFISPSLTGTSEHSIYQLITKINRRRHAKTPYENLIPVDIDTKNFLQKQKYTLESILEKGKTITIRPDACFETGGSIEEKTNKFPQEGKTLAQKVAKKLGILSGEIIIEYDGTEKYFVHSASCSFDISWHSQPNSVQKFFDFLFPRTKAF